MDDQLLTSGANKERKHTMLDSDFEVLRITAAITPQAAGWPKPDYSKTSIMGDKPHVGDPGEIHWGLLHDAVGHARKAALKACGEMSAIDDDRNLSGEGKKLKRQEIGTKAMAALKKSQHLDKARSAVADQVKRWDKELGLMPKAPEGVAEAMQLSEIRSHVVAMSESSRVTFVLKHATDARVVQAVLSGPPFLCGLSDADIAVLKTEIAKREVAAAKEAALKAVADAERGYRNALNQIRERASLPREAVQ
jgi:hypothetical protein